jgi:hypothetical protein
VQKFSFSSSFSFSLNLSLGGGIFFARHPPAAFFLSIARKLAPLWREAM